MVAARNAWGCLFLTLSIGGCGFRAPAPDNAHIEISRPGIAESLPHAPDAFTQGLLIHGDFWYESTGRYGQSELRKVDRATGHVVQQVPLDPRFFGEGLALWNGRLYQLTWKEQTCIVYDLETLSEIKRLTYAGEGWGLTACDRQLYLSDGSSTIRVIDPETFVERRRFEVRGPDGRAVSNLNELEWIDGEIWANVFQTTWIVRFSPEDGRVRGFVDLRHLPLPEDAHAGQDVLNGIAVDPDTGAIWVTGKLWTRLYRLDFDTPPPQKTCACCG